jgi:hypothetical protein
MKIRPVRAEVIADGSDMTKLKGSFRNFANAPKMNPKIHVVCLRLSAYIKCGVVCLRKA